MDELLAVYGEPRTAEGEPARLCVAALGKCGGRELGFASDIELMFVYEGGGETAGPKVITAAEFYEKLVVEFTRAIRARREGIFEIDLQLRPYGKAGSLAVSLDAFRRYFAPAGPAWSYERQALVKLRPIAGDEALGRELRALCDDYCLRRDAVRRGRDAGDARAPTAASGHAGHGQRQVQPGRAGGAGVHRPGLADHARRG